MDKQANTNKDSQLTEIKTSASPTELTQKQSIPPQQTGTETIKNTPQNLPQDNPSNSPNWQPGHQFKNGKYTIEQELGKGGVGITYLARDWEGRQVVIKMLKTELHGRHDFKQLEEDFVNEAVKLSQFKHPNIVPIIEVINDRGWCIVMEYIRGQTLADLVKGLDNYLTAKEALHYIKQVASALKAVHAQGLLHRDIKPQNILIREDTKEAVLIDFGLALKFDRSPITNCGGLSHGYAPLEQYQFNVIWDYYTDVYALAATLYFALTKTKPISAQERAGAKKLISPQEINPAISKHLNEVIEKGMTLDPAHRPQNVEQWLALFQKSKQKNNWSFLTLFTLFILGLGAFTVYFLSSKPSFDRQQIKFGQTLERKCTENDLHPLTNKCQKNHFFTGKKGDKITVEMSSNEIDSLLVLMDIDGIEIAKNDDISIDNFNAKIDIELPENGKYIVSTQSSQKAEIGAVGRKFLMSA